MIGGALNAMITAQVNSNWHYVDFLKQVCFPDGKAEMLQFDYEEPLVNSEGKLEGIQKRTLRLPLVAAVTHPNMSLEVGKIDFEVEVTQVDAQQKSASSLQEVLRTQGLAKIKGRVSHKIAQTRKTDKRAKYSIHAEVKRDDPSESLMRVIDFLTDAATQPANSWLLRPRDLMDPVGFIIQLRDSQNRISQFLIEQFSSETKRLLDEHLGPRLPSKSLQQALIQELNRLIQGESLYDQQRFEHVPLREKTRSLLIKNPQGEARLSLNRWLLEDAYPHELATSSS